MKLKFLYWFTFIVLICALLVIWWLLHHNQPDITADFQNRTSTIAVPANFLGSGGLGTTVSDQGGIDLITGANLMGNRIWANLDLIYPSGDAPTWSTFDAQMNRATQDGLSPIVVVYGTPPLLGASACAMPSNVSKWGQMAAQVVAHVAQSHPGMLYELWNEPDASAFCSPHQMQDYLTLWNTSAPLMKQADATARLGGPALAAPASNAATWLPAFLSGPGASYVDFVSFHLYITGTWLLPGMTWDQLYQQSQNASAGLSYYYRLVDRYVRQGSQPYPAQTPIYIDEYNANYAYQGNCCQNHAVYGPLWNSVAIVDFLNTVHDGAAQLPARLVYFMAGDANSYFCLMGVDAADYTNCTPPKNGQPFVSYPSLLTYRLFAQPDYLDIEQGAHIIPTPATVGGLLAAGFYTGQADSLVLVNPTGSAVNGLLVKLRNLGIRTLNPTAYTISQNNLVSAPLPVRPALDGVTARVDVPAYSTVALQLAQQ